MPCYALSSTSSFIALPPYSKKTRFDSLYLMHLPSCSLEESAGEEFADKMNTTMNYHLHRRWLEDAHKIQTCICSKNICLLGTIFFTFALCCHSLPLINFFVKFYTQIWKNDFMIFIRMIPIFLPMTKLKVPKALEVLLGLSNIHTNTS